LSSQSCRSYLPDYKTFDNKAHLIHIKPQKCTYSWDLLKKSKIKNYSKKCIIEYYYYANQKNIFIIIKNIKLKIKKITEKYYTIFFFIQKKKIK
jgi:hypothetical protein